MRHTNILFKIFLPHQQSLTSLLITLLRSMKSGKDRSKHPQDRKFPETDDSHELQIKNKLSVTTQTKKRKKKEKEKERKKEPDQIDTSARVTLGR